MQYVSLDQHNSTSHKNNTTKLLIPFISNHFSIMLVQNKEKPHKYEYSTIKVPYEYMYFRIRESHEYSYFKTEELYKYGYLGVKRLDEEI